MRGSIPLSLLRFLSCAAFPTEQGRRIGSMEKNVSLWISVYLSHPHRKLFWKCSTLAAICCSHKAKILLFQECFMSPRNNSSLAGMVKHNVESLWFSPEAEKSFQAFFFFSIWSWNFNKKIPKAALAITGICTLRPSWGGGGEGWFDPPSYFLLSSVSYIFEFKQQFAYSTLFSQQCSQRDARPASLSRLA